MHEKSKQKSTQICTKSHGHHFEVFKKSKLMYQDLDSNLKLIVNRSLLVPSKAHLLICSAGASLQRRPSWASLFKCGSHLMQYPIMWLNKARPSYLVIWISKSLHHIENQEENFCLQNQSWRQSARSVGRRDHTLSWERRLSQWKISINPFMKRICRTEYGRVDVAP